MVKFGAFLAFVISLLGCSTPAPSDAGIRAYREGVWAEAEAAFAPLAARGDAKAQLYLATMAVGGQLDAPLSEDTQRAYLIAAARSGEPAALGLMTWLLADRHEREDWLRSFRANKDQKKEAVDLEDGFYRGDRTIGADPALHRKMEWTARGPIPHEANTRFFPLISPQIEEAFLSSVLRIEDRDWVAVDRQLAGNGDKPAQARLALRYMYGRGLARDDARAIKMLHAAGSAALTSTPCSYQPSVRNMSSSIQCTDQGQVVLGQKRAQWELCQIYARGERIKIDANEAELWCNRAMNDPVHRTRARDALIEMNLSVHAE